MLLAALPSMSQLSPFAGTAPVAQLAAVLKSSGPLFAVVNVRTNVCASAAASLLSVVVAADENGVPGVSAVRVTVDPTGAAVMGVNRLLVLALNAAAISVAVV